MKDAAHILLFYSRRRDDKRIILSPFQYFLFPMKSIALLCAIAVALAINNVGILLSA